MYNIFNSYFHYTVGLTSNSLTLLILNVSIALLLSLTCNSVHFIRQCSKVKIISLKQKPGSPELRFFPPFLGVCLSPSLITHTYIHR